MNFSVLARISTLALVGCTSAPAQGVIGTFAGTEFLFTSDRLPALSAPLGHVQDVAVALDGGLFISDRDNHLVVSAAPDGTLMVFAGNGLEGFSGDGFKAVNASMRAPLGLAVDSAGNVYISDSGDHRVRKVSALDGTITTFAGTGQAGFTGDGSATSNRLNEPRGLGMDAGDNLYIADSVNNRVRKVTPAGFMTTIAGTGQAASSGDGGSALQAKLNAPTTVKVDKSGNVYIATVGSIRKISTDNKISTLSVDARSFGFIIPSGLAVDRQNTLYVSDAFGHSVYKLSADGGAATVLAGNGKAGFSGDGGSATLASLNNPGGLELSAAGAVYVADRDNLRVRRIDKDGPIRTVAGNGRYRFSGDGQKAISATLRQPTGIALDSLGSVLIADMGNNRIRKVTPDGFINTIAGNGIFGFSGDGGAAVDAALALPQAVAANLGDVYIADRANNVVRKVDLQGIISRVAGGGSAITGVGDNSPATQAVLRFPFALAIDVARNIYIADTNNDRIRKVTPGGIITTIAGGGSSSADGVPAVTAALNAPQGVAVDSQERIYISDTDNNRVRVVTPNGTITTLAGGGAATAENVTALSARVDSPRGIAVDQSGNVYFAEFNQNRVRRVNASGLISTVAGAGKAGYSGDGGLAVNALLNGPTSVALDNAGGFYIADSNNNRIRKVFSTPPKVQVRPATLSFAEPSGGLRSAPRLISISSDDLSGLPFSAAVLNNSPWLRVFPSAGAVPASLEVSADPGNLKPGSYTETIRITIPNAAPPSTDIAVQFTVANPGAPLHFVQPEAFSFAFVRGSAARTQILTVANIGGGSLDFTITTDNPGPVKWLSVQPSSGTATPASPALISVRADPGTLPEGTYTGTIKVAGSSGPIPTINVIMTISLVEQTIRLSQTGLTFTAVSGGGMIPPQSFSVLNTGRGVMKWNVSAIARPDARLFLSFDTLTGSTDASSLNIPSVSVRADPTNLPPGEYFNQIKVESPTALNSPQFIPVVLEVLRPDQNPGPAVQPSELVFSGVANSSPPGSQDLMVYNLLGQPLNYRSQNSTTNGIKWITYLPTEANIDAQRPARIVVQPDTTLLKPGIEQGVLTLQFDDGSSRKINITTVVLAPASGAAEKSLRAAQNVCTPKELVPTLTVLGQGFVLPAGYPSSLIAKVLDDCSNPLVAGRVQVGFNNGDAPVPLTSINDGQWAGTWTPSRLSGNLRLTLTAEAPALNLKKSIELSGSLRSSEASPHISPGGVVNAANNAPRQPLSPGGMITIYGLGLAPRQDQASALPLETVLAGTSAFIAGRDLPVLYASGTQVNAILPYDLRSNTEYQLLVINAGRVSDAERVVIAAAQPVIFAAGSSGGPAILDAKNMLIDPSHPAHSGDTIQIFAAGLGAVSGDVKPGTAPGVISTAMPVTVTFDQTTASPDYAGLSPTFPGLYQINVRVPAALRPGDVKLSITVAGQSSPEVVIPIR